MKVLAIDPGKKTGWAVWVDGELIEYGETEHYEWLDEFFSYYGPTDLVVCEDYLITQATLKKSRQLWSLYQIGVFDWLCRRRKIPFEKQTPAAAKTFSTDDRLKKLGWYYPSPGGHQNDALRHLVLGLVRHNLLDLELLR